MILCTRGGSHQIAPTAVRWRGRIALRIAIERVDDGRHEALGIRLVLGGVYQPDTPTPLCPKCAAKMPLDYCGRCGKKDPSLPDVLHHPSRYPAPTIERVLTRHQLGTDFLSFCRVMDLDSPRRLQARILEYFDARGGM